MADNKCLSLRLTTDLLRQLLIPWMVPINDNTNDDIVVNKHYTNDCGQRQPVKRNNKTNNKRFVSDFIQFEAHNEDSDDFDDEDILTQTEIIGEQTQQFVDDIEVTDSQPIGQLIDGIDSRQTKDMQSVYMRSVVDQSVGNRFKYKLKYDFDPTIDVYSQEPNESDLEDYQYDSFCVPNDCVVYDSHTSDKVDTSCSTIVVEESPIRPKTRTKNKRFKRIIFSP
ncbi:uncharacterized protein LOC128963215 [Oppia nitens]|uniref:uncharacterized protein LOC128963215 n=1 Tax=Oppia nitens TaxID=1686743 RepID=UPI0023DA4106|nr:uncharacterized protein LOC128963215 [Oppia nitens]